VDWDYNAWGNKYPSFDLDEVAPTRVAKILGVPVFYPGMILEGGAIDVNGAGALAYQRVLFIKQKSKSKSFARKRSNNACGITWAFAIFSGSRRNRRRRHGRPHR